MSKPKDDKPKDTATPKSKGGRRGQKHASHTMSENSLKNLIRFQKGVSGNPAGRSKTVTEVNRLAREKTPDAVERLYDIMMNDEAPFRDQITAAVALMDRGCGRPAVAVFQGGGFPGAPGEEESTSLLLRSAIHDSRHTKEYHLAELQRIEAEEAERDARLNDAAERLAKGEPIEGLTELLLRAKAENAKVLEAKPNVFIADSAGNIAAPASPVESAPPTPESADSEKTPSANPEPVPAKPAPFDPDPPPLAAKQPKSSHPGANMPGFAEFLSERATHDADAERAKKVEAARARGQCQIPPSEAFPPDPREGPEIVNFTRIPGRGIRRVG